MIRDILAIFVFIFLFTTSIVNGTFWIYLLAGTIVSTLLIISAFRKFKDYLGEEFQHLESGHVIFAVLFLWFVYLIAWPQFIILHVLPEKDN